MSSPRRFTSLTGSPARSKKADIIGLAQLCEATIYPHVFSNADREVGGILVGRAASTVGPPRITGAIRALSANEQRATLTFTQDAWEHIHQTLDRDFPPEEKIVGWYHSHPGFGIFLSEHDLFIHRNFFSGRSQIALVVDPIAQTEGVFAWRGDEIAKYFERATPGRWVASAERDRVLLPSGQGQATGQAVDERSMASSWWALVLAAVVGLAIGLGAWHVAFRAGTTTDTTIHPTNLPALPAVGNGTAVAKHAGEQSKQPIETQTKGN